MSATEELRRLLDERGVEHKDVWPMTLWGRHTYGSVDYYHYVVHEIEGQLCMQMHDVTPEQAIEATLGRGECELEEGGWSTEGDHARVWLTCGHDCMVETVADLPKFCPKCGRQVKQ